MLSIALLGSYHIYYHFLDIKEDELISKYIEESEKDNIVKPMVNKVIEEKEDYIGIVTIDKINLKEGFYNINSKNNSVNKSVTLLPESIMPDKDNSIVYLAAHSGNGPKAYFKNIYKLNIEDVINLNYQGKKYQYTVTDIYEVEKTGEVTINHNIHENYLVLTTCGKNNTQILIVSKLFNKI